MPFLADSTNVIWRESYEVFVRFRRSYFHEMLKEARRNHSVPEAEILEMRDKVRRT